MILFAEFSNARDAQRDVKSVAEENEAFANLGYKLHNDHSAEFKEDFVGILTEKTS